VRWKGHVASIEKSKGAKSTLAEKPEEKRPPARPTGREEENIKIDLQEWDGA
jgi:hypothetical protein